MRIATDFIDRARDLGRAEPNALPISNLSSNDAQQTTTLVRNGKAIRIRGALDGKGIVRSSVSFTLDGQKVRAWMGVTPAETAENIKKALPSGYRADIDRGVRFGPLGPRTIEFTKVAA